MDQKELDCWKTVYFGGLQAPHRPKWYAIMLSRTSLKLSSDSNPYYCPLFTARCTLVQSAVLLSHVIHTYIQSFI